METVASTESPQTAARAEPWVILRVRLGDTPRTRKKSLRWEFGHGEWPCGAEQTFIPKNPRHAGGPQLRAGSRFTPSEEGLAHPPKRQASRPHKHRGPAAHSKNRAARNRASVQNS